MKEDFAEMWEGKSEEELFSHYIETVAGVYKTGLHKRRAAARILARRKHQPTGEILTKWLNNPKKGIGKYEEHEWGTATSQPYTWYLADTEERHITHLAAESLGLMRYEKARAALEKLLLKIIIVNLVILKYILIRYRGIIYSIPHNSTASVALQSQVVFTSLILFVLKFNAGLKT